MKTLSQIKKEKQGAIDALLTECGVFWAFSNEQFAANKVPLPEGEKYVGIGAGGYMVKGKAQQLKDGLALIEKNFKSLMASSKKMRIEHIAYELANHEAYYTGDITDAMEALGSGYTKKEVMKVYETEKQKVYERN